MAAVTRQYDRRGSGFHGKQEGTRLNDELDWLMMQLNDKGEAIKKLARGPAQPLSGYIPLRRELDGLTAFITSEDHAVLWNRHAGNNELQLAAGILRDNVAIALNKLELAEAGAFLMGELEIGGYVDALSSSVREELGLLQIGPESRVVFIGSGFFPLSAITIAREAGASVWAVDHHPDAVFCGRLVAEQAGLAGQIRFIDRLDDKLFLADATHVIVASFVKDKRIVLKKLLAAESASALIAMRYGNGIKSLFNFPLELEETCEWLNRTRDLEAPAAALQIGSNLYDVLLIPSAAKGHIRNEPYSIPKGQGRDPNMANASGGRSAG
ncbi:hypothetical protein [Paenibacillus protaetiae]|uniref:Uncharacterized protein n=1 Tax=Paenibacillus protaetiae TaxID=2509456 RepID=A0A4P6ESQ7_9BACL|nr:hypothetical protein [Paenibacillus protaetiae]QAY65934.1 hypothetical protein ET464_05575 [Paenibacillus protaetiae]